MRSAEARSMNSDNCGTQDFGFMNVILLALALSAAVVLLAPVESLASERDKARDAHLTTETTLCHHEQVALELSGEVSQPGALFDAMACPDPSPCNDPQDRFRYRGDTLAVTPSYIRMIFHVIREDDGSNPAATAGLVDSQVVQLNNDFAPYGIQYIYTMRWFDSSDIRYYDAPTYRSLDPLKDALFIGGDTMLNVIVTHLRSDGAGNGASWTFNPDYGDPYGLTAGIVMSTNPISNQFVSDLSRHTLTHELGHVWGLAHDYVGTNPWTCGHPCAENLATGSSNYIGDLCEDTPPRRAWGGSTFFGLGIDGCSGLVYPADSNLNFMNVANTSKREFTPQQAARMRCYLDTQMDQWISGVNFSGDTLYGQAPLNVQFTGTASVPVDSWRWSFGDGDSGFVSAPSHTYTEPGLYAVEAAIESGGADYSYRRTDYVALHADSLFPLDAVGIGGESVTVYLYARNYLPLSSVQIPFTWSGPLGLTFDSATNSGLRSSGMNGTLSSFDPLNKRAYFLLTSDQGEALQPGSDPVVKLYFTVAAGSSQSDATVNVQDWSTLIPRFNSVYGTYEPTAGSGVVTRACCTVAGDADNSDVVNIGDITFLIRRIFNGSAAPNCCAEGDADGNGSLSIGDVTYLIQYIFSGSAAPICGPVDMGC